MNLKGPYIWFFIAAVLLFQGVFAIRLITEGLKIKFFYCRNFVIEGFGKTRFQCIVIRTP
jgi:hypothetical protein